MRFLRCVAGIWTGCGHAVRVGERRHVDIFYGKPLMVELESQSLRYGVQAIAGFSPTLREFDLMMLVSSLLVITVTGWCLGEWERNPDNCHKSKLSHMRWFGFSAWWWCFFCSRVAMSEAGVNPRDYFKHKVNLFREIFISYQAYKASFSHHLSSSSSHHLLS